MLLLTVPGMAGCPSQNRFATSLSIPITGNWESDIHVLFVILRIGQSFMSTFVNALNGRGHLVHYILNLRQGGIEQ